MTKKFFSILISILFLISVLGTVVYAEDVVEPSVETTVVETTNTAYTNFVAKVEAYASTGYTNTVVYTSDSVSSQGDYLGIQPLWCKGFKRS